MHPAAHGARVAAQQLGDGDRRPAVLGEQDHDQATADPVAAMQQPEQVAWVASRTGALGVHAGGTHTGAANSAKGSGTGGLQPLGLGAKRDGLLYVPASYQVNRPAPLVLMLHGADCATNAASWL